MIIDAIMFYNELDLLDIRLHELDSVVDRFVIVGKAAARHGSALPRKLVLRDNWHIVKPFEHKVTYVVLDKLTPPYRNEQTAYGRENYHRGQTLAAASSVATTPTDIVIVADCDEIPRAASIRAVVSSGDIARGPHHFHMDFFYYNTNCFLYDDWCPAYIGRICDINKAGGANAERRNENSPRYLRNGGWHFSYFGGVAAIKEKVASYLHASDIESKEILARTDAQLQAEIAAGKNIYPKRTKITWRSEIDPRLPAYLLANLDRFARHTAKGQQ